jgi:hypothetical protein
MPLRDDMALLFSCQSLHSNHITSELAKLGHCVRFVGVSDQPHPAVKTDVIGHGDLKRTIIHSGIVSCTSFALDLPLEKAPSTNELTTKERRRITGDVMELTEK